MTKLFSTVQYTPRRLSADVLDEQIYGKFDRPLPFVEGSLSLEKDPDGKAPNAPGAKLDAGKDRVWLMLQGFPNALREVSKVTTVGAAKYTPNGWRTVENGESRYMDAFGRHMLDLASGKSLDDQEGGIGTYHIAQMIWNLLASFELQLARESKN